MGRSRQRRLVVGQRAWSLIDPDVVVRRDIKASDLSDDPVVGKLLWPPGVSDEAGHFGRRRYTVHSGPLGKPVAASALASGFGAWASFGAAESIASSTPQLASSFKFILTPCFLTGLNIP